MTDEVVLRTRGADSFTGTQKTVAVDPDTQRLQVQLWVWDEDALDHVKMVQPVMEFSGDLTVTMGDVERLLAGNYWLDHRIERDSNNLPLYIGENIVHKAAEAATTWYVWKFTRTGYLLDRIEGPLVGSWTGRAALAWA